MTGCTLSWTSNYFANVRTSSSCVCQKFNIHISMTKQSSEECFVPGHCLYLLSPAHWGCPVLAAWLGPQCRYTASRNQTLGHLQFPQTVDQQMKNWFIFTQKLNLFTSVPMQQIIKITCPQGGDSR